MPAVNTTAKRRPPKPIIDNLSVIGDRRRTEARNQWIESYFDNDLVDGAGQDYELAIKFLISYDGSTSTFNAYRRELERLLQWSWFIREASVRRLTREDIVDFIQFVIKPPRAWIGTKNVSRFMVKNGLRKANPNWRPFVSQSNKSLTGSSNKKAGTPQYVPSQPAIRATFAVLSSFYDYLIQDSQITVNPVALIRQKSKFLRKDHNTAIVRRISNLQWDYVLETAELMASDDPDVHERTLFIMTALFAMYLRISELVADERSNPTMSDFRKDRDGSWWFHVTGKGNKDRTVTVSDDMMKALKRYRLSRGLSAFPSANENIPLIPKTRGIGPITSTRMIRHIVQDCFDRAYARMCDDGMKEDAQDLKQATVHWLRHTGISEDVQTRPREHVRDDAGHASMATTDRYIESDQRERHQSARSKRVKMFE